MTLHRLLNHRILFCVLSLLGLLLHGQGFAETGEENDGPGVVEADCSKCHENVVFALTIKGKAHQSLCLECHQGHPPADRDIIPSCSRCHTGSDHYDLSDCLQCHTNPHTPLEITLSRDITKACLSCHENQIKELQANPSIHTMFACTACHTYHGQLQPCRNCHLPHSDTMGDESCGGCHKAHMPLVVSYGDDIVSEDCGSCHVDVYENMVSNNSKHRAVACVSCHSGEHGTIPACEKCHTPPHAEEILVKFTHCGECHGLAHDLSATAAATSIFLREKDE